MWRIKSLCRDKHTYCLRRRSFWNSFRSFSSVGNSYRSSKTHLYRVWQREREENQDSLNNTNNLMSTLAEWLQNISLSSQSERLVTTGNVLTLGGLLSNMAVELFLNTFSILSKIQLILITSSQYLCNLNICMASRETSDRSFNFNTGLPWKCLPNV